MPYLVNIEDGVLDSIKKLILEDGFDLIEEVENNTGKNGINLHYSQKGANLYKVLILSGQRQDYKLHKEFQIQLSSMVNHKY